MSPIPGRASDAMHAVSRVLAAALTGPGIDGVRSALVSEAHALFNVTGTALLEIAPNATRAPVVAAHPHTDETRARVPLEHSPALRDLLDRRLDHARSGPEEAWTIARTLGWPAGSGVALLVPLRTRDAIDHILVLLDEGRRVITAEEVQTAMAFATAASAALAQARLAAEHAQRAAEQSALARAARLLNQSLDLDDTLDAICREARAILDGDCAVVYRGNAHTGLTIEHGVGLAPEFIGSRLATGEGLSGRVVQTGSAMVSNDYQQLAAPPADGPFADIEASVAVPMSWDGELQGVLSVGFSQPTAVGDDELHLLETFAEIAAAACRNATAATHLARAARTDGLTGCLNHAALQDGLRRELGRADRSGQPLSVILFDLDDFKAVNEAEGHLIGDEVLRRVGHALRAATRPYDLVARYGGDEFAIVATDADEDAAAEIAGRALARINETLDDLGRIEGTRATAGVAQREAHDSTTVLLEQADRALMFAKQEGRRGTVFCASELPDLFRPGRFRREDSPALTDHTPPDDPHGLLHPQGWPAPGPDDDATRLQRRARRLSLANQMSNRIASMTDVASIADAVATDAQRAFDASLSAVLRISGDELEVLAGRVGADPHVAARGTTVPRDATPQPGEHVAPIVVDGAQWGAVQIVISDAVAFDEEDATLLGSLAEHAGSAIGSALRHERLDRAYLGTAEALAAALEAGHPDNIAHARAIADWSQAVGTELGLGADELRDLRFGAMFHDIGKVAIPDRILEKPGPLTDDEHRVMEQHTIVAEQILAPVDFLARVLPIVRHEHERWDGTGYPDGRAGTDIPLGARIVLVCDAFQAMTSVRPYRPAMTVEAACSELRGAAGSQFDPTVVDAFLRVLARDPSVADDNVGSRTDAGR